MNVVTRQSSPQYVQVQTYSVKEVHQENTHHSGQDQRRSGQYDKQSDVIIDHA